ncbi:hypothetical protein ALP34_200091 [Pseudomonas savastanoi pv. glycinea]|uniref:Uncharacterized protein n=1 Tax=Pseudomonas amygdali pv. mori TaxID=34065 RepID=A0A3M5JML3_PSEA0|nr:hypothetical protein ALP52_200028 [Pseudomonas amygdali pv. mori]RMU24367.1 hypothetical protein ALP34_200091 [Pseudomonas savastanoi pv. glycinea]RMU29739.1 hypothetical protein ALP35_200099 [Pseudomonas savastanoi pv. glycinea]
MFHAGDGSRHAPASITVSHQIYVITCIKKRAFSLSDSDSKASKDARMIVMRVFPVSVVNLFKPFRVFSSNRNPTIVDFCF